MSDHYDCPVDWCEFNGKIGSVRGHVNGSTDPDHDWKDLKDQIEEIDDDHPEEGETSDEGGDTPSEGGDMATDDEYQNQTNDDQEESTDESKEQSNNEGASEGGSDPSAGAGAAAAGATALIAGQSMWVVVGIAALALLVVLMLTTDQGEPGDGEKTETNQEGGSEPSSEGDSDEEARGLVQ